MVNKWFELTIITLPISYSKRPISFLIMLVMLVSITLKYQYLTIQLYCRETMYVHIFKQELNGVIRNLALKIVLHLHGQLKVYLGCFKKNQPFFQVGWLLRLILVTVSLVNWSWLSLLSQHMISSFQNFWC